MGAFPTFQRVKAPALKPPSRSESRRESRHDRGYDHKWDRLRDRFIRQNPYCRFSEQEGRESVLATTVDHIIPIEEAPELRLVWSNLQSLSEAQHFGTKAKLERIARASGQVRMLPEWCASKAARDAILGR